MSPEKLVPIVDRKKAYLRNQKEIAEQVRLRKEEGGSSDDESIVFVLDKDGDVSIKLQLDFVAFQEEERQERLDNGEESSDSEDSGDEYAWYNKFS